MIRRSQYIYIGTLLSALLFWFLNLYEILPVEYLSNDMKETLYVLDIVSIILSLGGTFLALRLMVIRKVKNLIVTPSMNEALGIYCKWANIRSAILGIMLLAGIAIYYASAYNTSAKYCILISMIATVFCVPGKEEFEKLRNKV